MTRSWQDLQKLRAPPAEPDEFAILCAQALGSPQGRLLMEALHARYINHVLPGRPDDRALQSHHAKCQLVRELEDATAKGSAAIKKGTAT
jgi:hypothetical protein